MIRTRSSRVGSILAATLLGVAMLPGLTSAADTRILWIGAPDAQTNAGKLFPSKVTVPPAGQVHSTIFDVQILSTDNQNLSHTVLTITLAGFTGLSLATFFDPDGGTDADDCTPDGNVITCDYGSLSASNPERTVAVVANVASNYAAGTGPVFSASVITNNENGANQQLFTATSGPWTDDPAPGFSVGPLSANGLGTYVAPGLLKQLSTSALGAPNAGNLSTTVTFTAGAREVVSIFEDASSALLYPCPTGLSCQPTYSEVITASGTFGASPYFTWTLTAIVPKTYALSQGFVAHYNTPTTNDWTLFFKDKSAACGTNVDAKIAAAHQCIKTLSLTKYDKTSNQLLVEVVMDRQGGMKY